MSKIRIAGTVDDSIVDGTGLRYTIFTQGCPHHCAECHNPNTHSFDGGREVDTDELFDEIAENILLDGVTFSGGEPMCQPRPSLELARRIKSELHLNIIIYTGYTYEELLAMNNSDISELLDIADWLIDGAYDNQQRDLALIYRGSSNQRIINLKHSTISDDNVSDIIDVTSL